MPTYYSPSGNPEVWNDKPKGYMTKSEWDELHPIQEPEPLTKEELAVNIRAERNIKISETDYLLMPDYPISYDKLVELKEYRQALRDITKQDGFPENVEWPKKPNFESLN